VVAGEPHPQPHYQTASQSLSPWNTCLRQKGKINIKLIPSS
jgi:hypothetical protein